MNDKVALGSKTAKNGFKNENFVVQTFNAWQNNKLAKEWLQAMGYEINMIKSVKAQKVSGSFKADV